MDSHVECYLKHIALQLFNENIGLAYKFYGEYANAKPSELSDNIRQACLLGLWRACLNYLPGHASLSTYAYILMRHAALSEIRVWKLKKNSWNRMAQFGEITGLGIASNTTDEYQLDDERRRDLQSTGFFEKLSPRRQQILKLHLSGMDQRKIAKEVGITHQGVSVCLQEIIKIGRRLVGNV